MIHFDRVHLINLKRRPDRLEKFWSRLPRSWPFAQPELVYGLDGDKIPKPSWYTQQAGAWGCLRTHLQLYEDALNDGHSIFIFEDDCVFANDFDARIGAFTAHVPSDWDMVYLGGLHRSPVQHAPVRLNDQVCLGRAITTTYAYGISARFLKTLYPLLLEAEQHHIDQMLARLMSAHEWRVYCPVPWLVGMDAGPSDICGRYYQKPHFWEYTPQTARDPIYLSQLLSRVEIIDGVQRQIPLTSQQQQPALSSSIGGWFTDECGKEYRKVCQQMAGESVGNVCRLVEVGSWRGRSLSYLADLILTGEVAATAVDTWKGNSDPKDPTHGKDVYADFTANMKKLGIWDRLSVIREPSLKAASHFPPASLEVVMIDADHEKEHVAADLAAWWPKVRHGGVLMGHDYGTRCLCPGVVAAVDEFAAAHGLTVRTEADLWFLDKVENRSNEQSSNTCGTAAARAEVGYSAAG